MSKLSADMSEGDQWVRVLVRHDPGLRRTLAVLDDPGLVHVISIVEYFHNWEISVKLIFTKLVKILVYTKVQKKVWNFFENLFENFWWCANFF